jgi:PKD repeat protein
VLPQQPPSVVNNAKVTGYADVNGSHQLVQAETNFPTVILTLPVAIFTESDDNPIVNETVTFNASSSYDPDGHIVKFEWDWEGDGKYDFNAGTNPIATHAYEQPGIYYPTLRVTDNDVLTNETTQRKVVSSLVVRGYSVSLETAYPQTPSIIYVTLVLAVTAASAYLHFRLKHIRISLNGLGQPEQSA